MWAEESKDSKDVLRYVSADSIGIKEKASIRAKDFYVLSYADVVVLDREDGKWCFIHLPDNPSVKGWVSTSALSKRKIVANGRERFVEADEIALAGKGLDKSLSDIQTDTGDDEIVSFLKMVFGVESEEKNYFDYLETVDSTSVNEQELFDFIEDGQLKLQD